MYTLDLIAIDKTNHKAGVKGSNLGEMLRSGFHVSPGFVLTTDAYEKFLEDNKLKERINPILSAINFNNIDDIKEKSRQIEDLIISSSVPSEMSKEIASAYDRLSYGSEIKIMNERTLDMIKTGRDNVFVYVRPSVDSKKPFSSHLRTYVGVSGSEKILEAIKRSWASLYSPMALLYSKECPATAIIVQKMINSEKSGVIYTTHPTTNDGSRIVIEASWGLGQSIKSGLVTPDIYVVETSTGKIVDKKISKKTTQIRKDQIGNIVNERVSDNFVLSEVLNEAEIKNLWEIAIKSQYPQQIDWCKERNKIFLMNSKIMHFSSENLETPEGRVVSEGIAASRGLKKGNLKILKTRNDIISIQKGDIIASKTGFLDMFNFNPSAILIEEGGISSETAIAARECNIPCIVGVNLESIQEGEITVDGTNGKIYSEKIIQTLPGSETGLLITATEILSKEASSDGGFFNGKASAESIEKFAKMFYPKPVYYVGEYEEEGEINTLMGSRGIRCLDEKLLESEIEKLKIIKANGLDNICLVLPFVTNVDEFRRVKEISGSLKVGISCEIPSCALAIDDFCNEEIDIVSIGIESLTQLTLGIDKNNPKLSKIYSETNPSVLKLVKRVIKACKKNKIKTNVYGNMSNIKLVEKLIEMGVDSVSVESNIEKTKESIARIERRLILEKSR